MVFRNRLESNTAHWNSLLLSLQELIEWVIRKNAELESLGPMGGDTISLQKQLVSCDNLFLFSIKLYTTVSHFILVKVKLICQLPQDDHRAFRRQLEDKRHVIESNIQNSCQFIANEPALIEFSAAESTCLSLIHI